MNKKGVGGVVSPVHEGDNNDGTLTDTSAGLTLGAWIGYGIFNVDDQSGCLIAGNDATTVTCGGSCSENQNYACVADSECGLCEDGRTQCSSDLDCDVDDEELCNIGSIGTCVYTLRGGSDNTWQAGDEYSISDGYPCRDQIGTGSDQWAWDGNFPLPIQDKMPIFIWDNGPDFSVDPEGDHIQQNRDFYLEVDANDDPVDYNSGTGYYNAQYSYDEETFDWNYRPYISPHPLAVAPFGTDICSEGEISSSCWCEGSIRTSGSCDNGYYE